MNDHAAFGCSVRAASADACYAVSNVGLVNQETHEWVHPVGSASTPPSPAVLVEDQILPLARAASSVTA